MIYHEVRALNTRRDNLRWNAWGSLDNDFFYADKIGPVLAYLRRLLQQPETITPSLRLTDLRLPDSKIRGANLASLQRIVGRNRVKTDIQERVIHSAGRSYFDVIRLRMNLLKSYVDAVVYPETELEVEKLLKLASQKNWAVVPFGGGSSVVGGVEAKAGGKRAILSVDMTRMNRLISLQPENNTATFEAGIYGPDLELALAKQGYTLGHFPQSFEYSTLGGWVAARSAGQQSSRYGKIEDMVAAIRMITPGGLFETKHYPAASTGPDLNQILCGSEGTLGIITAVTIKLHELPSERTYGGFLFPDFSSGLDFIRTANQDGLNFSMLRLSDESETNLLGMFSRIVSRQTHSGMGARIKRFLKDTLENVVLQSYGLAERKVVIIAGADGEGSRAAIRRLRKLAPNFKGMYAGASLGRNWLKGRFNMPFLRNYLLEYGIGVDTMETAVSYENALKLHDAVLQAMDRAAPGSLAMCHASHSYTDGVCLYFTVTFSIDQDNPVGQWMKLKEAVSDAMLASGGNISHHHGIGNDHRDHFRRQIGPAALATLQALKKTLDPKGNLNPGKLMN